MDPQVALSKALENRNLKEFRLALEMDGDPTRMDDKHLSIFERALSTFGCADIVAECLQKGCRVDYINRQLNRSPINFAVDSKDPDIIKVLLSYKGVPVNTRYSNLTPLNSLAKNITAENFERVFDCIRQLIHYGANPNMPDQREITPIIYITKNKELEDSEKLRIVDFMLSNANIDLDTFRDGEGRQLLLKKFPQLTLPKMFSSDVTIDALLSYLSNENENRFLDAFKDYKSTNSEEHTKLLLNAIKHGQNSALDKILAIDPDINAKYEGQCPIEVATVWGNAHALEKLLDNERLNLTNENLLCTIIKIQDTKNYNTFCDYHKCFYILLESPKIDLNETDMFGSTPLHYAVHYKNEKFAQELMKRGAYLGTRSRMLDYPITDMDPELLEEHLDTCISTSGDKGSHNFQILMNFKNLIPPNNIPKIKRNQIKEEMNPITHIANSKEHRHLLKHPLITSFLYLKWHRLSQLFYMNFIIYTIFCISLLTFIICKFNHDQETTATMAVTGLITAIGMIYLVLREITQFIISPSAYLQSSINFLEILLILLTLNALLPLNWEPNTQRILYAVTILLAAVELCLLVGSLPFLSVSTHMLMLREVTMTFIKSFALYSIFVITFSLCFYVLLSDEKKAEAGEVGEEEEGELNKFRTPFTAIIKTIVMMTGEFDAGDLKFNSYYGYLVFLVFIFFMSIVLLNLLNGLAVSDTQVIKSQGELNGHLCRANVLRRYEVAFTGSTGRANFLVNQPPFRSLFKHIANLFPPATSEYRIAILPNDNNKVLVPETKSIELADVETNGGHKYLIQQNEGSLEKQIDPPTKDFTCCCMLRCSGIDVRTVKTALIIINKSRQKNRERLIEQEKESRLRSIEDKLEKMCSILNEMHNQN
ncbi:pain family protein [Megaselia abdita]